MKLLERPSLTSLRQTLYHSSRACGQMVNRIILLTNLTELSVAIVLIAKRDEPK